MHGAPKEPSAPADYKSTLNLPRTDFPMRGNLPKREPAILRRWEEIGLYERLQRSREGSPSFVLHDGPPYANGNIHIGHTLNKVLKDVVVKFRVMSGWRSPYVPGWDCHGLPIELQVERSLGGKGMVSKAEFRRLCREYAERYVNVQREEFRRLGVVGDWLRPYLTMAPGYEAAEVRAFGQFLAAGAIYRGRKPVLWCPSCATALAEAEVEYEELSSPSVYVSFPLAAPFPAPLEPFRGREIALVIWTTTPWTLPANLAIAVHPDLEYVLVEVRDRRYVVAKGLLESFLSVIGEREGTIVAEFPGRSLERAKARHPWIDRDSIVVLGTHVTLDAGTGCVHTAPGHGQEDYEVGLQYGLDTYAPVDARGRFTSDVEEFAGQFVFDADGEILARLRENGRLLKAERVTHSYPHCWRCKNPVIFRATDQWFVSMEKNDLRGRALAEIDRVRWIPSWGRDRIRGMMEARPDWCISRQRTWGVPIVAFYCQKCRAPLATPEIAERVAAVFEREGADAWFVHPASDLLPAGTACAACGGREFVKEEDILDVWFDSGLSHLAVLEQRPELRSPADLYLEGSDQHRGWFHTALLTSIVTRGRAPYDAVLTHGFTVDATGRKMSKSLGNVIAPQDVVEKLGAEILRLWVAAEDYRDDIRISDEIVGRLVEAFRRIRNTARFLIANLYDFDPAAHAVSPGELAELDRWILDRLQRLVGRCTQAYLDYDFHVVVHALNNFCSVDLSALYLDVAKDRLYCSAAGEPARRAAQTAAWTILDSLVRIMAPVLSFTAEDVWSHVPYVGERPESVFLADFPVIRSELVDDALHATYERLLEVRAAVTKALETERQQGRIGHSLDARVKLGFDPEGEIARLLGPRIDQLDAFFIVSEVGFDSSLSGDHESSVLPGLRVRVERAAPPKCARCWTHRPTVGSSVDHPDLCERCVHALAA
ncbi:MAG: isoleucyl-tRNA synthetase [Candidatus Binatota bacterium]|nr:isoleucyl-tRNA synthetase [Candidatus Binatota bacterium]